MLKKLKGLVETYAKEKTKEKALKSLSANFRDTYTAPCPFCGETAPLSRRYILSLLKEKASHPNVFGAETSGICEECGYTLYLLSTLTYTPRFFASTEDRIVEIEKEEDLAEIPPMSVVVYSYAKGNRLPTVMIPVPSPAPDKSITLNVIAGTEWFLFPLPKGELLSELEGYLLKARVLRSLKKYLGGKQR